MFKQSNDDELVKAFMKFNRKRNFFISIAIIFNFTIVSASFIFGYNFLSILQRLDQINEREYLSLNQQLIMDANRRNDFTFLFVVIGILFITVIVIASSYLSINAMFQISLIKDLELYKLLNNIGAQSKKIQKLVKVQAFRLIIIGVPIGIILTIILKFFTFFIWDSDYVEIKLIPSLIIYIITIILTCLIVFCSFNRPLVKITRNNYRITEIFKTKKYNLPIRNFKMSNLLWSWSFKNCFRNRQSSISVYSSLFLSLSVFIFISFFTLSFSRGFVSLNKEYFGKADISITGENHRNSNKPLNELMENLKYIENIEGLL